MRIGLVGASGSGKTKFARALRRELGEHYRIVDNYVPKLEKTTGLAYGTFATYHDNLAIAFKRYEVEHPLDEDRITCGTAFDTLCYAILKTDPAVSRDRLGAMIANMDTIIKATGWVYSELARYDLMLYLPSEPLKRYDAVLVELIQATFAPILRVEDQNFAKRVESSIAAIRALEEAEDSSALEQ